VLGVDLGGASLSGRRPCGTEGHIWSSLGKDDGLSGGDFQARNGERMYGSRLNILVKSCPWHGRGHQLGERADVQKRPRPAAFARDEVAQAIETEMFVDP
jgi:hypothetical protein